MVFARHHHVIASLEQHSSQYDTQTAPTRARAHTTSRRRWLTVRAVRGVSPPAARPPVGEQAWTASATVGTMLLGSVFTGPVLDRHDPRVLFLPGVAATCLALLIISVIPRVSAVCRVCAAVCVSGRLLHG